MSPRSRRALGACRRAVIALAAVVLLAFVGVAVLYLRLAAGPITLPGQAERLEEALSTRLGAGWTVDVEETAVELLGWKPAVRATGLELRNPSGIAVVRAPYAIVSFHPGSLLLGRLSPREIELRDLHLRGLIAADGTLSFATQDDTPPAPPPPLPAGDGGEGVPAGAAGGARAPSLVSAAAVSLVRPLVEPSGLIGALDRARLVDAKLSFIGPDGRERAAFGRVDAMFERGPEGDRHFETSLDGGNGRWRIRGRVAGAQGHASEIDAEDIPIADLLLLGGLSKASAGADLKVSGHLSGAFGRDRLVRLEAQLRSSPGLVTRKDLPPVPLDDAAVELSWDEAARVLRVPSLAVRSGRTRVAVEASMSADEAGRWHLTVSGRDLQVAALADREPPFRIAALVADAVVDETGLTLNTLSAKGDKLDMRASGSLAPGSSDDILVGRLEIRESDARQVLRLWPDSLNPGLRAFLAARVSAGTVESLKLTSRLDANDLRIVFLPDPMSDRSMDMAFAVRDVAIDVVDGLPPVRGLRVAGRTTGSTARLQATDGFIETADGRRLGFTDASFTHLTLDKPGTPARIGFRLVGGVDAVAALMKAPMIQESGAPDIDPASVAGRVDLRATLPLVPGKIPPLAQLAIELAGTASDVTAEKLPAKERLEGGQFALSWEGGLLTVKGDGKLGGSPATFDLRLPRAGGGELLVSAVLDEAARSRRSLPVAPALSGPVSVRVAVPLGGGRGHPTVDVDLGRAAIDGLLPGWQKPAGKPGRLTFALGDGPSTELRDVVLEAPPVQLKGQAVLSGAGGVEKADFSVLRLSPGDDARVQVERLAGGYRVAIKGNNIDARPIMRWIGAPSAKDGKRDNQDVDLDLATSILSGYNEELMTGVSAKASARGGELRSLQFAGRFKSAPVDVQLAKKDAGSPVLTIRAGDAGAALRFLDLYKRMTGGRLAVDARSGEGVQEGRILIEDFGLKGEPALRRIVAQSQPPAGSDERGGAPVAIPDVDTVLFNHLSTEFRRNGARMEYNDAVIYGPQVGFNLTGFVDHGRDRLDVSGTFVPAFALNNAFSQVPVVGLILGGGRTEGLIAVDFRLSGALSNPTVTVNPLTAVAPGILRKFLGWMMPPGGQREPEEASEASNQPGRRRAR